MGNRETDRWQTNADRDEQRDGQRDGRTETDRITVGRRHRQRDGRTEKRTDRDTDRWQTDGQMKVGWTERRTDRKTDRQRDGRTDDRRGERRTDRDMNEQRWTDITGTQAQLKVFNRMCETLHHLAGRGQRDGKEGRETEQRDGGEGELTDRWLSSVTITRALLNKSSRLVATVIWPIYSPCSLQLCSLMWTEVSI